VLYLAQLESLVSSKTLHLIQKGMSTKTQEALVRQLGNTVFLN
jgi:hypothetical protein